MPVPVVSRFGRITVRIILADEVLEAEELLQQFAEALTTDSYITSRSRRAVDRWPIPGRSGVRRICRRSVARRRRW